ncbi:hypothetical protein HanRHA438_Chr02g0051311 [Helianthus annuus]|uniref:Uncharacterized protein n=1 Tax=Helianthus annuus TaxID=4232 RepID=A0A251VE80_HELAN|nr:hypothetical protein HanXRQr2_Chr02g0050191 [Helianthus annuus]KAJ0613863.1 hypothetical protein HanIR_Chr02g0056071 [Helianthus annuus]KAJ0938573.1 hypothetical protein HanRHA438_Chr02g0051311 [Helianthus annuus]KAJ0950553.1 hypothetical protein HanPSC8_Chr02g0049561 [Helianthus annuus]
MLREVADKTSISFPAVKAPSLFPENVQNPTRSNQLIWSNVRKLPPFQFPQTVSHSKFKFIISPNQICKTISITQRETRRPFICCIHTFILHIFIFSLKP